MDNLNRTIVLYNSLTEVKLDNTSIQWYKEYSYKYTFGYSLKYNGMFIIATIYDTQVFSDNAEFEIGAEPSLSEYEEVLAAHCKLSDNELSDLLRTSINSGFYKEITEEQFNTIEYKIGDKLSKYIQ